MTWVIDKYYYIINFKYFLKPRIYPVYFTSVKAARRAIRANINTNQRAFYEIIKGSKLKEFQSTYVLRLGRLGKFTKYNYPPNLETIQQRKSYRTLMRRRLRRMGMLTLVKSKYNVEDKPGIIKVIRNAQEVANNLSSLATCFRLERKNPNWYYIILEKHIAKKKGYLFIIKALRVDIKTTEIKTLNVLVRRKDIIIPFLITEVIKAYGKNRVILDRCREEGIRFDKGKRGKLSSILYGELGSRVVSYR